MRSLITGIGGFAGGHLATELIDRGGRVAGLDRGEADQLTTGQLADGGLANRGRPDDDEPGFLFRSGDIRDGALLAELAREFRPDVIFHLAALTHVAESWDQRRDTLDINIIGTASVLEVAADLDPKPTVVLASSGQVYGPAAPESAPFRESDPTRPQSPYAVSKACAELLAKQAWEGEGVPTVMLRTFNYTGPWQAPTFVCSDFARQIAWAEAERAEPVITVGNLESRRDFSDVRDVVDGYIAAATDGSAGSIYNLASGEAVRIADILEMLKEAATVDIEVREDPERLRQIDPSVLRGDASRARRELDWTPRFTLRQTIEAVLDFWREQARRED